MVVLHGFLQLTPFLCTVAVPSGLGELHQLSQRPSNDRNYTEFPYGNFYLIDTSTTTMHYPIRWGPLHEMNHVYVTALAFTLLVFMCC